MKFYTSICGGVAAMIEAGREDMLVVSLTRGKIMKLEWKIKTMLVIVNFGLWLNCTSSEYWNDFIAHSNPAPHR